MGALKRVCYIVVSVILSAIGCSRPEVTITYDGSAQVELVSSKGTRVVVDLSMLDMLTTRMTESDILLTTHDHTDHFLANYSAVFKGTKMEMREGELSINDVYIRGIKSESEWLNTGSGHAVPFGATGRMDNYIYIIDMDGVRIAHFGDIVQPNFTADQLSKIGKVDVAIMLFDCIWHKVDLKNKIGFQLMKEIRPSIIIPTHFSIAAAEYAKTLWPCYYTEKKTIQIRKGRHVPRKTCLLLLGYSNTSYAELINAAEWKN